MNKTSDSVLDFIALTLSSTSRRKSSAAFNHFKNAKKILLLGEANFSYSKALLLSTTATPPLIISTSYDSKSAALSKYPSLLTSLESFKKKYNFQYLFSVDARSIHNNAHILTYVKVDGELSWFDRIAFNFPHLGGSLDKDVRENQDLLVGFFKSARKVLDDETGQILVTLRNSEFYQKWNIVQLAENSGLKLHSKSPFQAKELEALGYAPQRTNPAIRSAPSAESATVYAFVKDLEYESDDSEDEDMESESEEEPVPAKNSRKCGADTDKIKINTVSSKITKNSKKGIAGKEVGEKKKGISGKDQEAGEKKLLPVQVKKPGKVMLQPGLTRAQRKKEYVELAKKNLEKKKMKKGDGDNDNVSRRGSFGGRGGRGGRGGGMMGNKNSREMEGGGTRGRGGGRGGGGRGRGGAGFNGRGGNRGRGTR
ncbi:hypothetical protein HK098_001631 [Nowakowskiella sp. JEL0407]|nr:hypothetical protein HK098_001631 [Nowakowskiella sp. JEL0407]